MNEIELQSKVTPASPVAKLTGATSGIPARLSAPSQTDIAQRAHEIFVEKGCEHGHCEENWYQAESDMRNGSKVSAPEPAKAGSCCT